MFLKKNKEKVTKKSLQDIFSVVILLLAFCFIPLRSNAQCAMCRASLESTNNVTQAEAVNDGIVYLMVIPYVLVALMGFAIYRMYKKKK